MDDEVDFEQTAERAAELSARVDEELLLLDSDNLREIGGRLGVRKGRLHANLTRLQILREISSFLEKKCSESAETAVELLSKLDKDISEILKVNNKNDDVRSDDSEGEKSDEEHEKVEAPVKDAQDEVGDDDEVEKSDSEVENMQSETEEKAEKSDSEDEGKRSEYASAEETAENDEEKIAANKTTEPEQETVIVVDVEEEERKKIEEEVKRLQERLKVISVKKNTVEKIKVTPSKRSKEKVKEKNVKEQKKAETPEKKDCKKKKASKTKADENKENEKVEVKVPESKKSRVSLKDSDKERKSSLKVKDIEESRKSSSKVKDIVKPRKSSSKEKEDIVKPRKSSLKEKDSEKSRVTLKGKESNTKKQVKVPSSESDDSRSEESSESEDSPSTSEEEQIISKVKDKQIRKYKSEKSESDRKSDRKSSTLRDIELKSLKACWRPPLKIVGQIGGSGKDRLDYIGLKRQVDIARRKDPPYEDKEIYDAVLKSVTGGSRLRRLLEVCPGEQSLDSLMKKLKACSHQWDGKDLLQQLSTLRQDSAKDEDALEFVMRGLELHHRIIQERTISAEVAQEILLESLETGFSNENIRNRMRPYLSNKSISEEELLEEVSRSMKVEQDRKLKFEKKSSARDSRVNEFDVDTDMDVCQRNGPTHMLLSELKSIRAEVSELRGKVYSSKNNTNHNNDNNNNNSHNNNTNNNNDTTDNNVAESNDIACECTKCKSPKKVAFVEYGCRSCKANGTQKQCSHCFICEKDDHKSYECPDKRSSNSQGSLPRGGR